METLTSGLRSPTSLHVELRTDLSFLPTPTLSLQIKAGDQHITDTQHEVETGGRWNDPHCLNVMLKSLKKNTPLTALKFPQAKKHWGFLNISPPLPGNASSSPPPSCLKTMPSAFETASTVNSSEY